jgi:hypothetical protein
MWANKKLELTCEPLKSWSGHLSHPGKFFLTSNPFRPLSARLAPFASSDRWVRVAKWPSCPHFLSTTSLTGKKRTTMSISVRGGRTLGEGRLAGCRVQGAGRGSKPDWLQTGEWFNSSRSWLLVLRSAELRLILSSLHLCFLFICSMDANSSFHLEIRIVTPNCRCGGWFVAWTKSWIRKSPTS